MNFRILLVSLQWSYHFWEKGWNSWHLDWDFLKGFPRTLDAYLFFSFEKSTHCFKPCFRKALKHMLNYRNILSSHPRWALQNLCSSRDYPDVGSVSTEEVAAMGCSCMAHDRFCKRDTGIPNSLHQSRQHLQWKETPSICYSLGLQKGLYPLTMVALI